MSLDDLLCRSPLSARWLQDNLKENAKVTDAKLTSWKTTQIGGEMGFLSDIFSAKLTWSGKDAGKLPENVVVKVNELSFILI